MLKCLNYRLRKGTFWKLLRQLWHLTAKMSVIHKSNLTVHRLGGVNYITSPKVQFGYIHNTSVIILIYERNHPQDPAFGTSVIYANYSTHRPISEGKRKEGQVVVKICRVALSRQWGVVVQFICHQQLLHNHLPMQSLDCAITTKTLIYIGTHTHHTWGPQLKMQVVVRLQQRNRSWIVSCQILPSIEDMSVLNLAPIIKWPSLNSGPPCSLPWDFTCGNSAL